VCSLNLNSVINEQIESSGNQRASIEKKLEGLAFGANRDEPGLLDMPDTHRKRMPGDLREVRKHRVGYHRLYYSGRHTNCYYDACYLLIHKKGDNQAELDDDKRFQEHLINALADKIPARVLEDPVEKELKEKEKQEEQIEEKSWEKAPWYKKYWS